MQFTEKKCPEVLFYFLFKDEKRTKPVQSQSQQENLSQIEKDPI